jgi:phenylalanine ammonia-lyase
MVNLAVRISSRETSSKMLTENLQSKVKPQIVLDGGTTRVSQVVAAAKRNLEIGLTDDPVVLERVAGSAQTVANAVKNGQLIYGVTTGFGGMAEKPIPGELAGASQNNLLSFLATAAGRTIDRRHVRAAMLLRANVLLRGCSGVRLEIIERLVRFLQVDAIPVVRELGSIGASGDLVPLSTIARAITGQTEFVKIQFRHRVVDGQQVLQELELDPLELLPKEGLAIVNGTSFSSAIAANAIYEAQNLLALTIGVQSLMLRALLVHESPYEAFVHQCKPHPGQVWVAQVTKRLLAEGREKSNDQPDQVQDRYSLRCLPQYLGPIVEGIARINRVVETEMNSVSDNPLIDPETGNFYQSGNFLGQYLGIAMDDLRRYIGLMAKHLDVQIASLVSPEFSGGLTASLRGNDQLSYNMGLKGLQITGNSIMPLLTYYGNPVVEHFPTHAEQFNQNINGLSWGSANFAWNSVELFQQYMSVALIFAVQALDIRAKSSLGHYDGRRMLGSMAEPLYSAVCRVLNITPGKNRPLLFNDSDRWLEQDVAELQQNISNEGSLVHAVGPILNAFDESFLETSP